MAQKLQPTSPDLLVHPGETIAEAIEDRGISQKELAIRTGFTEKHISTVINGKKSISAKLAIALEIALEIPSTFWKNLQANYDLELESFNEINNITEAEIEIAKEIADPVKTITGKELNNSNGSFGVWSLRKILGVSNLTSISKLNAGFYRGQFNVDTSENIMYVWQYLSEKECESQIINPLNIELLKTKIDDIKSIMFKDASEHIESIKNILNSCGVLFTVKKHVTKAPIHGLTVKTKDNKVMLAMTIRNKYVDTFWFSLFHEIAHIINKDFLINQSNINLSEEIEERANKFASNVLINPEEYKDFIAHNNFSIESIKQFAEKVNVLPGVVAGRLMSDNHVPWSNNHLRSQYDWTE
jgi:HTH-type transcriptional regulator/antitoxin HigA